MPELATRRPVVVADLHPGRLGTVLGVWAHPDDETMLAGGLMHLLRGGGSRVVCATATRGERGTDDPARWPPHRLAAQRDRELRRALRRLGVDEHQYLRAPGAGLVDGRLHEVPWERGVVAVADLIARTAPDTVVTFAPDGFTGHGDHRRVGAWTDAAFRLAGRDGSRLLHVARTRHWWQEGPGSWLDVRMDLDDPRLPHGVADDELALDLQLDGRVLDRKVSALRAHRSQTPQLVRALGPGRLREWLAREQFVLGGAVGGPGVAVSSE
ncbi:PIG-L deacetylase family protein [Aquipuribacter sp. MA13-6]|uniref:PIG-L deacetylase family protein n=1 Tax=unclassified Aquipuribacter TaxID=2635084 RepID=UPI003EEFAB42